MCFNVGYGRLPSRAISLSSVANDFLCSAAQVN